MTGPFDFLHIKGRTAGSSNELSFDVLDAARRDLDEKRRTSRPPLLSSGPRPSQGSYSGVAGTSTLSAVPEVERRKRARRARAIRARVLAVIVLVALVVVGAFAGMRFYQGKVDYTNRFGTLVDRFVDIDQSLVVVDALMVDPLNTVQRDERDRALEGFDELAQKLGNLELDARRMAAESGPDADEASLSQIVEAARARESMLDAAADAFKLSDIANRQVTEANDAWNLVLSADTTARDAAMIANAATTEEATVEARGKTEEALALLTTARSQLSVIEQGISGLEFSSEIAYIDKRAESLEAGVETSDALLAGDRAAAIAANDAYNSADLEAAALASALPASISDQVKAQYVDEISRKAAAYASARASAASADSSLRAILSR